MNVDYGELLFDDEPALTQEEIDARKEAERKKEFAKKWPTIMRKALSGEPVATTPGPYYVRCGRSLGRGRRCLGRMGHSATCGPEFKNVCDEPLPEEKRCILTVGHRGECLSKLARGAGK
jgi:hypothetical protein